MVQLGILLTQQYRLLSVAAMLDVFETANRFCEADGVAPSFNISLLYSGAMQPVVYSPHPLHPLKSAPQQDVILIPAFAADDVANSITANQECLPWLQEQYRHGAEVASFCSGAFLLAASGLLNGKPATTHIHAAPAFAQAFPQVQLRAKEVTTFEDGVYTSGGATNSFHLMLRILEKYCGRPLAVRVAKYFAIDMDREQQTYFSTFKPLQQHRDELVTALQQQIEKSYREAVTVEDLMANIPASRRNLVRRFKIATGFTPIEYLQNTRVEAAKKLLESTADSVQGVMLDCGYNDLKAFRHLFRKATGMTPTAYREKFCSRFTIEPAAA
jgi:transcriptional regulator GlxA family with amidase domain